MKTSQNRFLTKRKKNPSMSRFDKMRLASSRRESYSLPCQGVKPGSRLSSGRSAAFTVTSSPSCVARCPRPLGFPRARTPRCREATCRRVSTPAASKSATVCACGWSRQSCAATSAATPPAPRRESWPPKNRGHRARHGRTVPVTFPDSTPVGHLETEKGHRDPLQIRTQLEKPGFDRFHRGDPALIAPHRSQLQRFIARRSSRIQYGLTRLPVEDPRRCHT